MITSLLRRVRPAACALLFGSVFGIAAHPATAHAQQPTPGTVAVRIETSLGTILAEIDSARAPISARNFLRYVDSSAYTGGRFHRTVTMDNQPRDTVRIEVIQGGANPAPTRTRFPAIPLERTNATGLKHRNGTLSMARGGPDSATSDRRSTSAAIAISMARGSPRSVRSHKAWTSCGPSRNGRPMARVSSHPSRSCASNACGAECHPPANSNTKNQSVMQKLMG